MKFLIFLAVITMLFTACNSDQPEQTTDYTYRAEQMSVSPTSLVLTSFIPDGVIKVVHLSDNHYIPGDIVHLDHYYKILATPTIIDSIWQSGNMISFKANQHIYTCPLSQVDSISQSILNQ